MATAAAAPTLIERVDPYWVMWCVATAKDRSSSLIPEFSEPNTRQHCSGSWAVSSGVEDSTLSIATIANPASKAQWAKSAASAK